MKTDKVSRIEIIDHTIPLEEGGGRAYGKRGDIKVTLSLQDDGRTLKVFIDKTAMNHKSI